MKLFPVFLLLPLLATLLFAANPEPDWRPFPDGDPDYRVLYAHGRIQGVYRFSTNQYRAVVGHTADNTVIWGDPCPCPVMPPIRNFGLATEKLRAGEHYTYNGEEIGKAEATRLVANPQIPDVSKKLRVVVVSPDHDRIVQDITSSTSFGPYKDKCIVQGYNEADWQVQGVGYAAGVTVTDASGKQLLYQKAYTTADDFVDALRKADPDYKPAPVPSPSPSSPLAGPLLLLTQVPWSVWLLIGAAAVVTFLVLRKKP